MAERLYGLTERDKIRIGATVNRSEAAVDPGQRFNANLPGGGGLAYEGQFKITDNGDDTVDVGAGHVISGTTVTAVSPVSGIAVAADTHLWIEITYNSGWVTEYDSGGSYPTQTPAIYRVLISQKIAGVWTQSRFSEIHNTRIVTG